MAPPYFLCWCPVQQFGCIAAVCGMAQLVVNLRGMLRDIQRVNALPWSNTTTSVIAATGRSADAFTLLIMSLCMYAWYVVLSARLCW